MTSSSEIALAYVGSIVPDEPRFHNAAFSRAGNMFQVQLLEGLSRAGLTPTGIFSVIPIPSFPRARRLLVGGQRVNLGSKLRASLLPFINFTPIKQLLVGLMTFSAIIWWGWRNRRAKFKIVYTFNLTVPPGLFTYCAARCIGAKTLASLNDILVPEDRADTGVFQQVDFWLQKRLIPLFDGLVAVSDKIIEDFAPGKSYLRLEGGVTKEMFKRPLKADRFNMEEEDLFIVVSAGRLDEMNGIHLLLDSFALIDDDRYRLRIAGTGPLEGEVRRAANNDPRIEYCGFLSLEDVLDLYATADILVNMRLTKARKSEYFFPSKLMEYLASGTPVVTTCTGHAAEEFGDFVFLLEDESATGLADILRASASLPDEVRLNMGKRAREYMQENKTWGTQGIRLLDYIREEVL